MIAPNHSVAKNREKVRAAFSLSWITGGNCKRSHVEKPIISRLPLSLFRFCSFRNSESFAHPNT